MRQLTAATLQLAVQELADRDRDLGAIIERCGAPPLWARRPGGSTLVRIILEQHVSLAPAKTMYERLRSTVGTMEPQAPKACATLARGYPWG